MNGAKLSLFFLNQIERNSTASTHQLAYSLQGSKISFYSLWYITFIKSKKFLWWEIRKKSWETSFILLLLSVREIWLISARLVEAGYLDCCFFGRGVSQNFILGESCWDSDKVTDSSNCNSGPIRGRKNNDSQLIQNIIRCIKNIWIFIEKIYLIT